MVTVVGAWWLGVVNTTSASLGIFDGGKPSRSMLGCNATPGQSMAHDEIDQLWIILGHIVIGQGMKIPPSQGAMGASAPSGMIENLWVRLPVNKRVGVVAPIQGLFYGWRLYVALCKAVRPVNRRAKYPSAVSS